MMKEGLLRTNSAIFAAVVLLVLIPVLCCGDSLIEAAKRGDALTVSRFIKAGVDPNSRDSDERTALIWAAAKGHKDVVNLLLSSGAAVNAADNAGNTALILPSATGSSEMVGILLSKGADPNARAKNGFTPLYVAVSKGEEKTVRLLLENGADPNKPGYSGLSVLAAAVASKNVKIVDVLLDHGATGPEVTISEPKTSQKTPDPKTVTQPQIKSYANDYFTMLLFLLNRMPDYLRENAIPVFKKYNLIDAQIVAGYSQQEDKFEMLLTSGGSTPVFKTDWVDPLFKFLSKRGDFPPMSFRNGSVTLDSQTNVVIDSGMELMVGEKTYRYTKDKDWELIK
ncbi:MAG TPA: ankyrin repeat domain-containing protein [Syntrophorhabdaceae bacterium]|nr:ankyrin repeat domain-containing protein [Syntrophorhabdaceae bacterium]